MPTDITSRQLEIIQAAGKILTESGVGGLTIKNLAKEMQFSESALYRHFKCKEDIIVATLKYLEKTLDELYEHAVKPDDTPEEKLVQLFLQKFRFFKANPHFAVVVFSDGLMESSEAVNKAIHGTFKVKQRHLNPIIEQGQATGVFTNELSADQLIHLIMGSVRLQMLKWRIAHFDFDIVVAGNQQLTNILKLINK
jgi:AcrR family transcriptional regulator